MKSFSEVLGALQDGPSLVETEEKDNPVVAPATADPAKESPAVEDKLAEDPVKPEETETKQPEATTEPKVEADKQLEEQPPEDYKARLLEAQQEAEQLRAQAKEAHAAATRKFQEASRLRDEAVKTTTDQRELVKEINLDPDMREFLKSHPDAIGYLMEDPKGTRLLLGNKKAIDDFWDSYETITSKPHLAAMLAKGDEESTKRAEAELAVGRAVERSVAIGQSLDNVVESMAANYPGVNVEDVRGFVMRLGGVTEGMDAPALFEAFERLHKIFFVDRPEGVRIDTDLIRDRYEMLSAAVKREEVRAAADAERHNKEVDAQLKNDAPAATPSGGVPAAIKEKPHQFKTFEELNLALTGG